MVKGELKSLPAFSVLDDQQSRCALCGGVVRWYETRVKDPGSNKRPRTNLLTRVPKNCSIETVMGAHATSLVEGNASRRCKEESNLTL